LWCARGLHLVGVGDFAHAIHGFEFRFGLVGAASLHDYGRLADIGEGGKGFVSLHVATSLGCLSDQVLTESKSVN